MLFTDKGPHVYNIASGWLLDQPIASEDPYNLLMLGLSCVLFSFQICGISSFKYHDFYSFFEIPVELAWWADQSTTSTWLRAL